MSTASNDKIEIRRLIESDFDALIALQSENLIANLSEDERGEGFLSAMWDEEKLSAADRDLCVLVSADGDRAVGFIAFTTVGFNMSLPLPQAMMGAIADRDFQNKPVSAWNACICGPVCIAKTYRGRGIFEDFYTTMPRFVPECDLALTLVSLVNARSLRAHKKVGMMPLHEFDWSGRHYLALAREVSGF